MKISLNNPDGIPNENKDIFIKHASNISFSIEDIHDCILLCIKVSFDHIDLEPGIELTPCNDCKRKAPNRPFLQIIENKDYKVIDQGNSTGHHIITIKFEEKVRKIKNFDLKFNCSGSHIKQKNKIHLQFMQRNNKKSKEEGVAEFWVSVNEFPSRSLKSHKGLKMKGSKNSAGNLKAKKIIKYVSIPLEMRNHLDSWIVEKGGNAKLIDKFFV